MVAVQFLPKSQLSGGTGKLSTRLQYYTKTAPLKHDRL